MSLPQGRVRSLLIPAEPLPDAEPLTVSFDQGRHLGEGDRSGSWMAISFRLRASAAPDEIADAWTAVVERHGTLGTVFDVTDGQVRVREARFGAGRWIEHPAPASRLTRDVLREVLDAECRPFASPSHRLCLVEPGGGADPTVVIASDHSHVDMWSLLILARDLAAMIDDDREAAPLGGGLPVARAFADHSAELATRPPAPAEINTRWAEILEAEGGRMPIFPLTLGDVSTARAEIVDVRDVFDADEMEDFHGVAAARGVRAIALAMSVMTQISLEMGGQPLRAVFPVHSRHQPEWHDAVGWFITNSVIECDDPSPAACARSVKEAVALGSHPLGPILAPYGGMPATPGMFAVSWLDTGRLPIAADRIRDVQYVSAVIRTDGVMIWFIANESGLHLRCRYPDTPEARRNVSRWLDAVHAGLRDTIEGP
ncbi:hypothetical protein GCM10009808_19170 [Microbacterium sediminicola]|uniref:Peptide synthetase n=2 Tax=Microbacterium sediminicola TaxID=415210 RepID=A0ABN2IAK1_9MICO